MKNPECTELSPEEEAELMRMFPKFLDDEEESIARQFFKPLVFFQQCSDDRQARRCVCTSCMEGFTSHKLTAREFFKASHGKRCECPNCGQASTLAAVGKFSNFDSLTSRERAVQLTAYKDWLLIQAGWITRTFDRDDLGGYLDFEPFRRYALAPGRRMMWSRKTVSWFREYGVDGPWMREESIREPFQPRPYEQEAAYIPLGIGQLAVSSLRWCQYELWFNDTFGSCVGGLYWDEEPFREAPFRIAHLIQYLAEYTRRPQMEILAKLEYFDILTQLVIHKCPNANLVNWNAKSPPEFFRLSKQEYRVFAASDLGIGGLKSFRRLRKMGVKLDEFLWAREACLGELDNVLRRCAELGVGLGKAVRYLQRVSGYSGVPETARLWRDYLDAARKLGYDLSRPDVAMPKDLRARHDAATAAVKANADAIIAKNYAARFRQLTEQFAFELDGLCVRVPQSMQEIVDEGRTLQHCVGGYAARHAQGKVTILFLRKMKNPEAPYVTMELSTEQNPKKLRIVQIHGFRNDIGAAKPPEERHKDFLGTWLSWIHDGSPRLEDGTPDVPEKAEEKQDIA